MICRPLPCSACAATLAAALLLAAPAGADDAPPAPAPPAPATPAPATPAPATPAPASYQARVVGALPQETLPEQRATSSVDRADIEWRLPRSAPDALRYEAGVFIQQSAHGQASVFLRGLTGQQTVLLFDGIRLNNSTYRQGPNQYFFTVDSQSVSSIDVQRSGGSTRWGSDALGGAILTHPLQPRDLGRSYVSALARLRFATADSERGGRLQLESGLDLGHGRALLVLGGIGGRDVGLLRSAGSVTNPNPDSPAGQYPLVPRFAPDGRTQLGTGFRERTYDLRLSLRLSPHQRLTAAAYLYREYDAPRTDQCPPPTAPADQCLTYEEQLRHLFYLAWDGSLGRAALTTRVTLSFQQQHERRRLDNPGLFVRFRGIDDVNTVGLTARAATARLRPHRLVALQVSYGLDSYFDLLSSSLFREFTDTQQLRQLSRGQYLDGSSYLYGGVYTEAEARVGARVRVYAGGRFSFIQARAPGDPESGTRAIDRGWYPVVGHVGLEWRFLPQLHALVSIDHSFRAPNLDDLTSRQQTGPGFQFENPDLDPERATSFEAGLRLRARRVTVDVWAFETLLDSAILKMSRLSQDCPADTPQCQSSWSRFQLVNAPSLSELRGAEGAIRLDLPLGLSARATVSYVWGEGPRVGDLSRWVRGAQLPDGGRVPLSRVPPLNGTVELRWDSRFGLSLGAALRWADAQHRLAIADYSDGRIPKYGTPGFAVFDLRGSYQLGERLRASLVFENVTDATYRYHGSSINGPERGLLFTLGASLP